MNKLPGCVSQGEAPQLGDAPVHHEPPKEQGGVTRGAARRVARRHPWRVGGRACLRHGLQLGQRGPADHALLFQALRECLAHGPRVLPPSVRPSTVSGHTFDTSACPQMGLSTTREVLLLCLLCADMSCGRARSLAPLTQLCLSETQRLKHVHFFTGLITHNFGLQFNGPGHQ